MEIKDGPVSPCFTPLPFTGNLRFEELQTHRGLSEKMQAAAKSAPSGSCVAWGIPFEVGDLLLLVDQPAAVEVSPVQAGWLVFMHTYDRRPPEYRGFDYMSPTAGNGTLNRHLADYAVLYEDGSEARAEVRRLHQIGPFDRKWGDNCFQAVASRKPHPVPAAQEQLIPGWGLSQTRVDAGDWAGWMNWLWAWQNPYPEKTVTGLRFEPRAGTIVLSAVSAGTVSEQPLRWRTRRKALLRLPEGTPFLPEMDENGLLAQIKLDLGQVISARPRLLYPQETWQQTDNNSLPEVAKNEYLIEYTAHPDALFHLWDERVIPVSEVEAGGGTAAHELEPVASSNRRVMLRVVDRFSRKPLAVKLHVHGLHGEYLAPVDRRRIINPAWFEDYSVDFSHQGIHACTYIPGESLIDLPLGKVFIEISKGFEIRPVRRVVEIGPGTDEALIEIEKALPWRERGWVTADTHVHFLSPGSALLEGAGEGVNIVNLLASQWGELMTNAGDFDGRTTFGSKEAGGDGEYLVRVGTENRQHVLGHISLLGYSGRIIAPMTTGGADESALGDPIEILLTEWARRCKQQGGLVVLPHFPNPRLEHAASIVSGEIDAVEMTSWSELYNGISPYSLLDWYRYLNCGYLAAAVGGSDKMAAVMPVGAVRTYARIPTGAPFTYPAWMDAVRRAETFVTYGPLLEFSVNGLPMGSRLALPASGGTLDVTWEAASVTVPMSRVELVVNGEIRESAGVAPEQAGGHWAVKVDRSAWLALLARGHYPGKPEIIAAHTSPVMVDVEGSQMLAAADAVSILEQIEGAMAYLDSIGTRAEDRAYKRMRLVLESAHRSLHNRMHRQGHYHDHTPEGEHH